MDTREPCHSRNISVNCFYISDEIMAVEGSLKDERLSKSANHSSYTTRLRKDTIHHMYVKMNVSLPQLKILSISAEMAAIPNEACAGAKSSVDKLIGVRIKHGFTDTVRNILANQEGCAHIMNLILSMGSAAVQGAWSALGQRTVKDKMPAIDETIMINSCWLWRDNGPLAAKMRASKRSV